MNISKAIIAKSDQLNASDLIGGPQTVTIAEVREGNSDQPVQIHLVEWPGRPFKPSKTVLRILDYAWGEETDDWPQGARMTILRDPTVKWGGEEVGGIRVSHLSHIAEPFKLALRESQKKSNLHTIYPILDAPPQQAAPTNPERDNLLTEIKTAAERAGVALGTIAAEWADSHDGQQIKDATDLGALELIRDDLNGRAS